MKKRILLAVLVCAVSLSFVLSACSAPNAENGTPAQSTPADGKVVDVYNWGEYIDESIFATFKEETGITVNYTTFATNEELYAKLKSGGAMYDVIIPSDYMISRMIEEDMLEKLDYQNIPNYASIDERFAKTEYDPTNEYSVPYMWGTVGIVFNKTKVTEPVDSWQVLFDKQYAGQILMFDNSRDAFGIALKLLGYSFNTTDEAQINEAYTLLQQQKPLVQAYVMDQIFDKLAGDEAIMGPYYAGDAITMIEENPDLSFVVPKEGANTFIDAMCIPKGATHKAEGEAFINFMCSDAAAVLNADSTGYSTPSKTALALLDEEVRNNPIIYPPSDVLDKCETFKNLPKEISDLYDNLWIKLKSE